MILIFTVDELKVMSMVDEAAQRTYFLSSAAGHVHPLDAQKSVYAHSLASQLIAFPEVR